MIIFWVDFVSNIFLPSYTKLRTTVQHYTARFNSGENLSHSFRQCLLKWSSWLKMTPFSENIESGHLFWYGLSLQIYILAINSDWQIWAPFKSTFDNFDKNLNARQFYSMSVYEKNSTFWNTILCSTIISISINWKVHTNKNHKQKLATPLPELIKNNQKNTKPLKKYSSRPQNSENAPQRHRKCDNETQSVSVN